MLMLDACFSFVADMHAKDAFSSNKESDLHDRHGLICAASNECNST